MFEYDISEFIDFFSIRVEQIGIEGSVLEAVVNYILPCRNINEVADKLNKVVEGANSPEVKKEIQEKLEKQVSGLFENQ